MGFRWGWVHVSDRPCHLSPCIYTGIKYLHTTRLPTALHGRINVQMFAIYITVDTDPITMGSDYFSPMKEHVIK